MDRPGALNMNPKVKILYHFNVPFFWTFFIVNKDIIEIEFFFYWRLLWSMLDE